MHEYTLSKVRIEDHYILLMIKRIHRNYDLDTLTFSVFSETKIVHDSTTMKIASMITAAW